MCSCHKGENNGACNRGYKDCLLYAKFFLMQLSVALGLHFGWGSQLNTSEMFWIDISRWMISNRSSWILVYLFWRTCRGKVTADVRRVEFDMGPLLRGGYEERVDMVKRLGDLPKF